MKKLIAVFLVTAVFALGACATCPMSRDDKVRQNAQQAFDDLDAQRK